jgi:uncharacterized protein YndB with AHSA1/START domain
MSVQPEPLPRPDRDRVRREVVIAAAPEEIWECLATEEGRDRWLEDEPEREIEIEFASEPRRLVWWWSRGGDEATRVEFQIAPVPGGTRVIVTEFAPSFPIALLASSFALVPA